MEKRFTAAEAQALYEKAKNVPITLQNLKEKGNLYLEQVNSCAFALKLSLAQNLLADIPIDELQKAIPRLKIKSLREKGLLNYAQVFRYSEVTISNLYPVGLETAKQMKAEVQTFVENVAKSVKIKIDIETKNAPTAKFLQALYIYRKALPNVENCITTIEPLQDSIATAAQNLEPATHAFKYFFKGKLVKLAANSAYDHLSNLLEGDFQQNIQNFLGLIAEIENVKPAAVWDDFEKHSVEYYTLLENLFPEDIQKDGEVYGLPAEISQEIIQQEDPTLDGLKCSLRRYQQWGVKYILHQGRVLLGDEMGLGKTVQAIAAMVALRNGGYNHFIVICPASVLTNWCREIEIRSNLKYIKIHGPNRESDFEKWKAEGGVAVSTYETTSIFSMEAGYTFDMLVVDEAHYIKNPFAKRSQNVRKMCEHTNRILFMTGTALENRVNEMISLMSILRPQIAEKAEQVSSMFMAPQFIQMIAPVYYRRKREQVLSELPELIESEEWCEMSAKEQESYEDSVLSKNLAHVRQLSFNIPNPEESCKIKRIKEIVEEAEFENRKVIIFSFFLNTIATICDVLGERCMTPITGAVSPQSRQTIIDDFSKAPAGSVLVSQITSGGVGLNIQTANVVILCEPQYKPSAESQAISRAFRMGQVRNVLVYRLLCSNTIDEKFRSLLKYKQGLFDTFADKSVSGEKSFELDSQAVKNILDEEIQRIQEKRALPQEKDLLKEAFHNSELAKIEQKKKIRAPLPGELPDEEYVVPSEEFFNTTFEIYNNLYFDGALPKIPIISLAISNAVGQYVPVAPKLIIINSSYKLKYYQYRNVIVHEMCHYFTDLQGKCVGGGDGHSKEWVDLAEQLNSRFPELQITLYCDEKLQQA